MDWLIKILEFFHAPATLISLGLTWPGMAIACLVLARWHKKYIEYCFIRQKTPSMMLIVGIYIAFFGSVWDNGWWGIAWSLDFIDPGHGKIHYWRNFFFHYGVFPNVVFRQSALFLAGLLHVSSNDLSRRIEGKPPSKVKGQTVAWVSICVGILYVFAMLYARMKIN